MPGFLDSLLGVLTGTDMSGVGDVTDALDSSGGDLTGALADSAGSSAADSAVDPYSAYEASKMAQSAADIGQTGGALASAGAGSGSYDAYEQAKMAQAAKDAAAGVAASSDPWSKIAKGLNLVNSKGQFDYSDPKVMGSLLKLGALGAPLLNTLLGGQSANQKTPAQIRAELAGPYDSWSPQQQASMNQFRASPMSIAQHASAPITGTMTRGYAAGGPVAHGALGYVQGPGGGQSDNIHAAVSPGEYMFDADLVSALGDGNNAEGAKKLDAFREAVRAHKRSAPPDTIPPKAKAIATYMQGALSHG